MVLTTIGGTLGLTSAYGVGDPTITRRRVEADLAVFREYRLKYEGMLEACTQQLAWGVERYAKLPPAPEFLKVQEVPSFWMGLGVGLAMIPVLILAMVGVAVALSIIVLVIAFIYAIFVKPNMELSDIPGLWLFWLLFGVMAFGGLIACVLTGPIRHFRAKRANGERPQENARRQTAYEEATDAALKAAERSKAAEDHRLRLQIRELEGLAKTVAAKEAEVRRILATL